MTNRKKSGDYGTVAVHLAAETIAQIDAIAQAEDRSKSNVIARLIRREMAASPASAVKFARRATAPKRESEA